MKLILLEDLVWLCGGELDLAWILDSKAGNACSASEIMSGWMRCGQDFPIIISLAVPSASPIFTITEVAR